MMLRKERGTMITTKMALVGGLSPGASPFCVLCASLRCGVGDPLCVMFLSGGAFSLWQLQKLFLFLAYLVVSFIKSLALRLLFARSSTGDCFACFWGSMGCGFYNLYFLCFLCSFLVKDLVVGDRREQRVRCWEVYGCVLITIGLLTVSFLGFGLHCVELALGARSSLSNFFFMKSFPLCFGVFVALLPFGLVFAVGS
ncbi:hypothetical protein SUGI_1052220 [Cryptomeria japonica]|nr:hypothetical protein SUGI_1052220 [Cryptomeria japonica]